MKSTSAHAHPVALDPTEGGYSDRRLWPFYTLGSALAILAVPLIGEFLSMLLVIVPVMCMAVMVVAKQDKDSHYKVFQEIQELYDGLEERDRREAQEGRSAAARAAKRTDSLDNYKAADGGHGVIAVTLPGTV